MTEPEDFIKEVAERLARVEERLGSINDKLDLNKEAVSKAIDFSYRETSQAIQFNRDDLDRLDRTMEKTKAEAEKIHKDHEDRLKLLESFQSNLLGKIAVAMFLLGVLIAIAMKVWVKA